MFPHRLTLNTQPPAHGAILKIVQPLGDSSRPLGPAGRGAGLGRLDLSLVLVLSTLLHECHHGNQAAASHSLCLRQNVSTLPSPPWQTKPPILTLSSFCRVTFLLWWQESNTRPKGGCFPPPLVHQPDSEMPSQQAGELMMCVAGLTESGPVSPWSSGLRSSSILILGPSYCVTFCLIPKPSPFHNYKLRAVLFSILL